MRRTLSSLAKLPTSEERFLFDLNGFIHLKNVLTVDEVKSMNTAIDIYRDKIVPRDAPKLKNAKSGSGMDAANSRMDMGGMMSWNGEHGNIFRSILAHPSLKPYLNCFLGAGYRLDHAPMVIMNGPNSEGFHLHGGPVDESGDFDPQLQYRSDRAGSIWTSLLGVSIALMDSEEGEGGYCVLPGSHKTVFPLPTDLRHGDSEAFKKYIHTPNCKAGDVILFSEATIHGALPWTPLDGKKERRLALYRFGPGVMSYGRAYLEDWGDPTLLDKCTEDEAAVLAPPFAPRLDRKIPGVELVKRDATKRAHDKMIFGTEYF